MVEEKKDYFSDKKKVEIDIKEGRDRQIKKKVETDKKRRQRQIKKKVKTDKKEGKDR